MTEQTKAVAAAKPLDTVRALLERSKDQIKMALPRHMNADRMARIAMTAVQKTPKLLECRPVSLVGAIIQCAQLGLEPNDGTGRAWLIPYGTEVQFIPGYRGLVDLTRRSGEIKRFDARAVYSNDTFSFQFGLNPDLTHIPAAKDRGELTHVYAVAEFKDGGTQFDVMTREDVEKVRSRSKSGKSGPWVTDYEEMAKKTVTRRICKMLPVSPETQIAVTLDERADRGLPQNLAQLADPSEPPAPEPEAETEAPIKPPQRASEKKPEPIPAEAVPAEAKPEGESVTFTPQGVTKKASGKGHRYSVKAPDGSFLSTFSDTEGGNLIAAEEQKQAVKVSYAIKGDYKNITAVELAA